MRSLIYFFALITTGVCGQSGITNYQSFVIDNKEVAWAQVYHNEEKADTLSQKIFRHLKRKVWIKEIHYDGSDIVAELANYRPDYKRYGGKYMNTSTIIRTGKWDGKVRISFKDEKYRVIIYGLHYVAKQSATTSGKASIEQHEVSGMLSEFVLNDYRNAFRKNRLKNLDILHLSFKDSFTLTADQIIDTEW